MGVVWATEHRKKVEELRSVLYQNLVREDIQKQAVEAYRAMGKEGDDDMTEALTLRARGGSHADTEAFRRLTHDNPFGTGARKMVDEYAGMKGREVSQIVLHRPRFQSLDGC